MIGIVLVTHGFLADALLAALEERMGPQPAIRTICIGPEDDMEQRRQDILAATGDVDRGKGVILITDMFGGTPSNLAISLLDRDGLEVIAGANHPMLHALAEVRRDRPLAEAVETARRAAFDAVAELGTPDEGAASAGTTNPLAPVGLVLVGFDGLPSAFKAATEHVVGPQEGMIAFGLQRDGDRSACRSHLQAAVDEVDRGNGVLILLDARTTWATECALSLDGRPNLRIVGGVNLPMLIKLASIREDQPLPVVVSAGLEAGRKYIHVASTLLAVDRS